MSCDGNLDDLESSPAGFFAPAGESLREERPSVDKPPRTPASRLIESWAWAALGMELASGFTVPAPAVSFSPPRVSVLGARFGGSPPPKGKRPKRLGAVS